MAEMILNFAFLGLLGTVCAVVGIIVLAYFMGHSAGYAKGVDEERNKW